jgi:hypothetical protein
MKTMLCMLVLVLYSLPLRAQFSSGGLQDGGHGSGGDEKAEYTIATSAGWNIVSVPVTVPDFRPTVLFPTALTGAFAYAGGYVPEDSLVNGPGYWIKFGSAQSFSLSGALINTDTIPVAPGWNLVGAISSPVASGSVTPVGTTLVSGFFSFDNGYQPAPTLDPGKGYWVKVGTAGALVLSSGGVPEPGQDPLQKYLSTLNSITVLNASGAGQTLYFAADAEEGAFELPPVPPSGVFDARFASQQMAPRSTADIVLSSATWPVVVQWNIVVPGDYALVINGKETPLSAAGMVRVAGAPTHLSLRVGAAADLPTEFALAQNYPNPFNPATHIEYAVPVGTSAVVSLHVFDVLGRDVATLVNEAKEPGRYAVRWDAGNVASGVYYYRLHAGSYQSIRKMLLLK